MTELDRSRQCAIAVMAKAPREGAVKTRLVPPLSFAQAARLSSSFLKDITENIRLAAEQTPIAGYVAFSPAGVESMFDGLLAPGTNLLLADGVGESDPDVTGFGRCLLQTIRKLLGMGYGSAVVLNSDSPTLPTAQLCRTARLLSQPDAGIVLGPAEDGGYYLLGARSPEPGLFSQIAWSTDQVAAQTRQRARDLGLGVTELESWYDVDDREGLSRLVAELGGEPAYPAPATSATLAAMGLLSRTTLASGVGT